MPLRLRISLPDRPGALGQVTRVLGIVGADIVQVTVLERGSGRAVDEFGVTWPEGASRDQLVSAFQNIPGVRIEGIWPVRDVPESMPELDLLGHVALNPDKAVATLVDAMPNVFNADWAAALAEGRSDKVVYASWRAPASSPGTPDLTPLRPIAFSDDTTHYAAAPLPSQSLVVVVARCEGPVFHQVELLRMRHLIDIFTAVVHGRRP